MSTVEQEGAAWPGIGLALGGGIGVATGAVLSPWFGTFALPVGAGIGALAGLIAGTVATMRVRRRR
jgi:hypothetical protein